MSYLIDRNTIRFQGEYHARATNELNQKKKKSATF